MLIKVVITNIIRLVLNKVVTSLIARTIQYLLLGFLYIIVIYLLQSETYPKLKKWGLI